MLPSVLYYNCDAPVEILESRMILPSKSYRHGGVSMSEWGELGSHGPFKFAFKQADWFRHFAKIQYGPVWAGYKNEIFKDEQEWFSGSPIRFNIQDVLTVVFMVNAPNPVIGPRKLLKIIRTLRERWPTLYGGDYIVNDPYLKQADRKEMI